MFRSTKRASTAGRGAAAPTQPGRGFLLKRGKGNKDFQRRFFVLQGAQLSYFETDDTGRSPKGQVVVASVRHAAKADAPECDDAQIGAAFVYTDPDGMATVVRTEGGADAKVEWLRVLAAATGGDKAPRVKVADYFGSAADAWAENQKRLNVVAASHRRFSSGGGGGDDAPAGERTSSSPAGTPEKPASPPKRGSIVDRRGSVRGSAVGGSTAARDPDEALASVAEGAKLNASGEAAAAQAAYERALGLAGYAPTSTQPQPAALCALFELGSIAAAAGDVAAAAARFEGALAIAPKECAQQVKLQLAWAKWQGGKRDEAARIYAEVRASPPPLSPSRPPNLPPSGPPALLRNPIPHTIPPHPQVLEEDVLCMPALLDRARFSMRGGGWASALSDLEMAISLGEDSADAWNDCGAFQPRVSPTQSRLHLSLTPPPSCLLPVSLSPTSHEYHSSSPLRRLSVRVGAAGRGVRVLLPSAAPPPRPRRGVRQSRDLPQGAGEAR
jgi:tetratricopeptide (TPR) repeat protein